MTIGKFTWAVSLVLVFGLTAWSVLGLAAPTFDHGSEPPSPDGEAEAPAPARSAIEAPDGDSEESTIQHEQQRSNQPDLDVPDDLPPVVVNIEPKVGATNVDPGLGEIRVTFSKKMTDKSWSWAEGKVYSVPKLNGTIHYEEDKRTCVMPVKLEPGKTYVLGINSERYRNFKDSQGRPALPYLVVFHTKSEKGKIRKFKKIYDQTLLDR